MNFKAKLQILPLPIKNDKSEMKNIITKMNNTLEGINSRMDEAEDQISDL